MNSRRCYICEQHWPVDEVYKSCPRCREDTEVSEQPAMDRELAESEAKHGAFGWWLYENDLV